jgi:DNA-binding transcriptional regulator YiaG
MSSIATVIKSEIIRLARRQLRAEIEPLKKQRTQQRQAIAALREEVASLRREMSTLKSGAAKAQQVAATSGDAGANPAEGRRFSPTRLRQMRERLGLSRREVGLLIGTTEQSLYNWESGSARPRPLMIAALAQVREGGKREAMKKLAELAEAGAAKPAAKKAAASKRSKA